MRAASGALAFAATLIAVPAFACGVSGPGGAVGCSLAEHEEAAHPWKVGASAVTTSTTLHFSGAPDGDQTRNAVLATVSRRLSHRWSFETELGVAFAGELRMPDGAHRFDPGPTAAMGVSYRLIDGRPFLILTALASLTGARTGGASYEAYDVRFGALFGTTLWNTLSPYAALRAFGGPVLWRYQGEAVTGTDASHYQLGAGLILNAARRLDVFIEGVPLGERSLSGGVALGF